MLPFNIDETSVKSVYDNEHDYLNNILPFVSEFKHNFGNKSFMKIIINQVIDRFRFEPRLNNTLENPNFVSSEFGSTNLILNVNINTF